MKATIIEKEKPKPKPFPKLMVNNSTGSVVLMDKTNDRFKLVVLKLGMGSVHHKVGEIHEVYTTKNFSEFDDELLLSN